MSTSCAPSISTSASSSTSIPRAASSASRAGGRLHRLLGLVLFEPTPRAPDDSSAPFAEALWHESYEAEQHVLHLGRSDEPVCWTLCGFASGYLSCCNGREILCVEERCAGKGDALCTMVGKPRDQW